MILEILRDNVPVVAAVIAVLAVLVTAYCVILDNLNTIEELEDRLEETELHRQGWQHLYCDTLKYPEGI